jgi:hypothetical protein
MRNIKSDEYKPGLVLARDIEDAAGYKLLKVGTVLSDAQIALLVSWKVREIWVEDAKAAAAAAGGGGGEARQAAKDSALEAAKKNLRKRFEGQLVNPWMKALYAEAEKRIGEKHPWR